MASPSSISKAAGGDAEPAPLQVFERIIAIRPEDILGGHVNNTRYFGYIGDTFNDWYNAMGLVPDMAAGPMMAHLSLDFLREMTYPGRVLCQLRVVRLGKSSLEHSIELRDADQPDVLHGKGKAINVWVNLVSHKTEAWPNEVVARCWAA